MKKKKKTNTKGTSKKPNPSQKRNWVENLTFVPISTPLPTSSEASRPQATTDSESLDNVSEEHTFSIVSWNILAESYCSPKSHICLPDAREVFDRSQRRRNVFEQLHRFCYSPLEVDVLCLQEVDIDVQTKLNIWGYHGVETPTTKRGGGTGGRIDACGIYVRSSRFEILETEQIALDDLASLQTEDLERADETTSTSTGELKRRNAPIESSDSLSSQQTAISEKTSTPPDGPDDAENADESEKPPSCVASYTATAGLGRGFLRRNVGLLVRLRDAESKQTFVVANAHLYWNPGFEYVKLCQMHYILQRAKRFLNDEEPLVLAGDLNSRPRGAVHSYLTHGGIAAKHQVSPWYSFAEIDADLPELNKMVLEDQELDANARTKSEPKIRYLLDATLNKLCRWLRILGQDTAIESESDEQERTQSGICSKLFDRARREHRVLVTTSVRLLERRDCPAGTYCLHPSSLPNLEVALVHMLRTHGVCLEPSTFLSRCVVCNGTITKVDDQQRQKDILQEYAAPILSDLQVYECNGCRQGYWWCDLPTSSASRVKLQATRLLQVCLRGGIPICGSVPSLFDHVDVASEQTRGWDFGEPGSDLLQYRLCAVDWLAMDWLKCPLALESVYAHRNSDNLIIGESLPFTNVTETFVNVLDYIYYPPERLCLVSKLNVPTSFQSLNTRNVGRGHLLPSRTWPSDHLAIGGVFRLRKTAPITSASSQKTESGNSEAIQFCQPTQSSFLSPPPPMQVIQSAPHPKRCDCGCVPSNIPSLFEMAELRRQAKLKAQAESR